MTRTIDVWGLTGGIASGKTTAAQFFSELGIPVVDADLISRQLSAPEGAAHLEIVRRFGTADRVRLREIVFKDPSSRKDLETILHPYIILASQNEFERLARETQSPVVIYEAALLVETARYQSLQGLIVVEAPVITRKSRLLSRSGLTEEMAEQILNSQISDEKRREAATIILENSGSLDQLREKVRKIALAARWIST